MRREKTGDLVLSLRLFAKQTEMEVLAISSAVRGFHVYKDIWKPSIGDKLACEGECDNCFDKFAQRRNSGSFTMQVLEDRMVPF